MTWTHNALAEDLAAHLRGASDRLIRNDMQLGASGSPRPDVYSVPCSFARFQPVAYECKISVADFRRDVTAGKWTSYLRFAAGVIFAAPAGLLKKGDVPAGCGLIVRGPDGWRLLKGPTLKNMENLPRDAWVKLIIDGLPREVERQKCEGRAKIVSEWKLTHLLREKLGDLVADAVRDLMGLVIVPISLEEANAFVATHHRHHAPAVGHKFSIAVADDMLMGRDDCTGICGVVIVGRPVARGNDDGWTLEVTRCCTDGTRNACSALYGAAWRAARALGYTRLITYTLPAEGGASLRGAGWRIVGARGGGNWNTPARPRVDTAAHLRGQKLLWEA